MNGGTGAKVLVVDDEANITDLVGTALRYVGFDVAVASSGRGALAKAREFRPDLIVLDVMLPDLDGFEVTRRLRSEGVAVPVVFLTARDDTGDKVAGLTMGGDDYVTKPFSLEELVARVRPSSGAPEAEATGPASCASPTWSWTRRPTRSPGQACRWSSPPPSSTCFAT